MINNIIEIPSAKKEVLRVAAYYRVTQLMKISRPVWIRRFNIIQTILTIIGSGKLWSSVLSRHRAHALTTEPAFNHLIKD